MRGLVLFFCAGLVTLALSFLPGAAAATSLDGMYYLTVNDAPAHQDPEEEHDDYGALRRDPDGDPIEDVGCERWLAFWFRQPGTYPDTSHVSSLAYHIWVNHTHEANPDYPPFISLESGNPGPGPSLASLELGSPVDSLVEWEGGQQVTWELFAGVWELGDTLSISANMLDREDIFTDDLSFKFRWYDITVPPPGWTNPSVPIRFRYLHSFIIVNPQCSDEEDTDLDGLDDLAELASYLNPYDPDTDGDGSWDGDDTDANDHNTVGTQVNHDPFTLYVDEDYNDGGANGTYTRPYYTIASAVDAADPGAQRFTIILKDGTYKETGNYNVVVPAEVGCIRSAHGWEGCAIDCANASSNRRAFRLSTAAGVTSAFRNLWIRNGDVRDISWPEVPFGGAFYLTGSGTAKIEGCVIQDCQADKGGAIYCGSGSLTVLNSLLERNSVPDAGNYRDGGAIAVVGGSTDTGTATIRNCTFTENTAWGNGGAIFTDLKTASIKNDILYGDLATNGYELSLKCDKSHRVTVGGCDVQGNLAGVHGSGHSYLYWDTGNLDVDPDFVDAQRHLDSDSPCIDEGLTAEVPEGELDLGGNPRVVNDLVDIGAHEYAGAALRAEHPDVSGASRATRINGDKPMGLRDPGPIGLTAGPNPFREATTIRFEAPASGIASLGVYDVFGRRIRALADGAVQGGVHALAWDGRDDGGRRVAPGLYLLRLQGEGSVTTEPVVLIR